MKKPRERALLKSLAKHWGDWTRLELTPEIRDEYPLLKHAYAVYSNQRFEVQMFAVESTIGGVMQVTAMRHGNIDVVSWEEMQRILHELLGPEVTAVEVYPPLAEEWNTKSNVKVTWVLPGTWEIPFGLHRANAWGRPNA